jgi:uncharacterized membrane protein YebE (DUF533 family)
VDAEEILDGLIEGVLAGRGKRADGARRALGHGGSLVNAKALLAAAGVAWGLYETWQRQTAKASTGAAAGIQTTPPGPGVGGATVPRFPPDPQLAPRSPSPTVDPPEPVLRLVRLMVSAARCDGTLTPAERALVLERARAVGAEAAVERELASPCRLGEIVAGVTGPGMKATLYTLAFAVVRADETVTGAERIYLAQLASHLGLDPEAVSRLEAEAGAHIDAEAGAAGAR